MEVMGLMLGEFVDDYTVRVIDVFAMPQSGTVCIHHNAKIIPYLCLCLESTIHYVSWYSMHYWGALD